MTARFPKRRSRKKSGVALTAEFSGTVTDSVTGEPVANATIYVVGQDMVVTTDADGFYLAEELPCWNLHPALFSTGLRSSSRNQQPITCRRIPDIQLHLGTGNPCEHIKIGHFEN